jgi:tRNA(fMet)-specific endonuclease VapC
VHASAICLASVYIAIDVITCDAVYSTTDVMQRLGKAGTPIGANDTAIAAHAIASHCTLVTNNVREIRRVRGLVYED